MILVLSEEDKTEEGMYYVCTYGFVLEEVHTAVEEDGGSQRGRYVRQVERLIKERERLARRRAHQHLLRVQFVV